MSKRTARGVFSSLVGHPALRLLLDTILGGIASLTTLFLFRAFEWLADWIWMAIPVNNDAALQVMRLIYSWGGAVTSSVLFIVLSWFNFAKMLSKLREE